MNLLCSVAAGLRIPLSDAAFYHMPAKRFSEVTADGDQSDARQDAARVLDVQPAPWLAPPLCASPVLACGGREERFAGWVCYSGKRELGIVSRALHLQRDNGPDADNNVHPFRLTALHQHQMLLSYTGGREKGIIPRELGSSPITDNGTNSASRS